MKFEEKEIIDPEIDDMLKRTANIVILNTEKTVFDIFKKIILTKQLEKH